MFSSLTYKYSDKHLKKQKPSGKELFLETYNQIAGKMFSLCIRYAGNTDDAQKVFIKGITALYHEAELLKPQNLSQKKIRSIFVQCSIDYLTEHENNLFKNVPMFICQQKTVLNGFDEYTEAQLVKRITLLPARYRIIFNLYLVEDYSIDKICHLLNINRINVTWFIEKAKWLFVENSLKQDSN